MNTKSGFLAARQWCKYVEALNREAIATGSEPNYSMMAASFAQGSAMYVQESIEQHEHLEAFVLAMSEFVSAALNGCVIIPNNWNPLE